MSINDLLNTPPFSLSASEAENRQLVVLNTLTSHHYANCFEYKRILDVLETPREASKSLSQIPFIPIGLFKRIKLLSTPHENIVKAMTSSGTSGAKRSQIFLDRENSFLQTKVLGKLMGATIGNRRRPMLMIEKKPKLDERNTFSASAAGIKGFSFMASDIQYVMDSQGRYLEKEVAHFLKKHDNKGILIFGFTATIWEFLINKKGFKRASFKIQDGILIHGGGWKTLESKRVSKEDYNSKLSEEFGITHIINYYGMIEQTGSIFLECRAGYFHTTLFSTLLIRNAKNFKIVKPGDVGLIQLISVLPHSYPGHSILTEDIGKIHGIDNCDCGQLGIYFEVIGRLKNAEIRGCSDAYGSISN